MAREHNIRTERTGDRNTWCHDVIGPRWCGALVFRLRLVMGLGILGVDLVVIGRRALMPDIERSRPSPFPEGVSTPLAERKEGDNEFDPTFGGTAVLAVLPAGSDAVLARRVRHALGIVLSASDDPPVVIVVPEDVHLAVGDTAKPEPDGGRRYVFGAVIPLVIGVGKAAIKHIADVTRHQQQMDHAAHEAIMRDVEEYKKRSRAWQKKPDSRGRTTGPSIRWR
jgi:hypothetical protein